MFQFSHLENGGEDGGQGAGEEVGLGMNRWQMQVLGSGGLRVEWGSDGIGSSLSSPDPTSLTEAIALASILLFVPNLSSSAHSLSLQF